MEACNDTDPENPEFPDYTNCPDGDLLALGLIVGNNVYEATDIGFVRFDSTETTKGKGRAKATDITSLFTFTGWVFDSSLDLNGDGFITFEDVPSDMNGDGVIDEVDFELWLTHLADSGSELATYFEDEWILNIADLVVTEQGFENDGVKLLKVRFYPVATTVFE